MRKLLVVCAIVLGLMSFNNHFASAFLTEIIIRVETQPAGADGTFEFNGEYLRAILSTEDNHITTYDLPPNDYSTTQVLEDESWELASITCDGTAGWEADLLTQTLIIHLEAGDAIDCTFHDVYCPETKCATPTPTPEPTETPTPEPSGRKMVVFVQGYASCLTDGKEYGESCGSKKKDDGPFDQIKEELKAEGFKNKDFLEFSYKDVKVNKNGDWSPDDYNCTDVTDQKYEKPAKDLLKAVEKLKESQPDDEIYIVGHSFGGLVAFQAMAQAINDRGLENRSPLPMAGVITIDAPLNGIDRSWLRQVGDGIISNLPRGVPECFKPFFSSSATNSVVKLYESWPNDLLKDPDRSAAEDSNITLKTIAEQSGTTVLDTGNDHDCIWVPSACTPYSFWIDPGKAVSGGRFDYPQTQTVGTTDNLLTSILPDCKSSSQTYDCGVNDLGFSHTALLKAKSAIAASIRRTIAQIYIGPQVSLNQTQQ